MSRGDSVVIIRLALNGTPAGGKGSCGESETVSHVIIHCVSCCKLRSILQRELSANRAAGKVTSGHFGLEINTSFYKVST